MFKKSFVSIFFSSDRLQLLQLNSSKNKVIRHSSVNLPAGIITDYKVRSKEVLAKLINEIWEKLEIKEKAVGLVVPEFSTFTKLFSLPKLAIDELDEAVRWQAQDFLPQKLPDMVMDWKIVKRLSDGYQVLAVAMDKEILEGYVDAAVTAGLFPLVVETPSLSLVRLSAEQDIGRLILYNNFGEGILVIAEGERILGSSIIPIEEKEEIVRTASQIIAHYKDTKAEKLIVGGYNFDGVLAKSLEKELTIPTEWVRLKMEEFTDAQIQEYLVPISLQLKEPAKPSDENTINLLPAPLVRKYENEKFKLQIWSLSLTVTLFVWISFLAVLGAYLFLTREVSALRGKSAAEQRAATERAAVITQVKEINQLADRVLKIKTASVSPTLILDAINSAKPGAVIITKYKMDLDKGEIKLEGTAQDRLSLVEFKQRLEEIPQVSSVVVPVSSFEVETNLEFKITFQYGDTNSKGKKGE